jgi:hypothetical protein
MDKHLRDVVSGGDETHEAALKAMKVARKSARTTIGRPKDIKTVPAYLDAFGNIADAEARLGAREKASFPNTKTCVDKEVR